ncbi:MAG TPA: hypothetical protein VGD81_21100 [Opitutaceae bacterium]
MNTIAALDARALAATFAREFLSYRINRFLHLHVALMLAIGLLALLAPPEAAAPGTAWWVQNGVLYVASLSALLLGLSSAQAETEEFALLFTQPLRLGEWVAGKCAGLLCVVAPSAALLVLPTLFTAGGSPLLLGAALSAAAVSVLLAWTGLALGFWIHDPVRGLIAALAVWCVLLFGVDLLLILIGGSTWIHEHPLPWVAVLMLSPLDAYRVTLLFVVERAAFDSSGLDPLTRYWLDHAETWLAICMTAWSTVAAWAAAVGARRRCTT